jgi:hypothetical protein
MPKLCGTCQKIIAPGHVSISIMNEDYHQQCLVCSKCGANLGGRPFIQKRTGEMYCEGQCEDSVTLPAINGNASSRNVFLFHQDPNIYREKINSYKEDLVKDLAREDLYDPYFRQHQHPAVVNESGKRSYNLDLYKKPPPKLSANLDIFKQTNYMNDNKNSKNIYEPFSYNYPSNGTLPINEKNPMSNSNNSLKNSKKTEPFSYNYRDTESNSNEIEDTASFKRHKTKPIKVTPEPFNYNRLQEVSLNSTNYNTNRKIPSNQKANMSVPYATMDEISNQTDKETTNQEVYKNKEQIQDVNVLNPIDSNRMSNMINQNNLSVQEISNYCYRCHQYIDRDKFVFNRKSFHKKCYTCYRCNSELFRMKRVLSGPNDDGIFCEPCHTDMYGPKCPKCNETVTPYMLSTFHENKLYHKECFICQRCKRNLANEKFIKSGNLIICKKCY